MTVSFIPGDRIRHKTTHELGTIRAISTDRAQAVVSWDYGVTQTYRAYTLEMAR